jgi:hypothetical protein
MQPSKTSLRASLTLYFQQFRANRIIKQSTTRKYLQANSRAIDTHLVGRTLGHLVLIISYASYAMIAPTTDAGPTLWISPQAPGRAPANTDGTATQISAARHVWEEDVQTYRTYTSVQQALKKQIISVCLTHVFGRFE